MMTKKQASLFHVHTTRTLRSIAVALSFKKYLSWAPTYNDFWEFTVLTSREKQDYCLSTMHNPSTRKFSESRAFVHTRLSFAQTILSFALATWQSFILSDRHLNYIILSQLQHIPWSQISRSISQIHIHFIVKRPPGCHYEYAPLLGSRKFRHRSRLQRRRRGTGQPNTPSGWWSPTPRSRVRSCALDSSIRRYTERLPIYSPTPWSR